MSSTKVPEELDSTVMESISEDLDKLILEFKQQEVVIHQIGAETSDLSTMRNTLEAQYKAMKSLSQILKETMSKATDLDRLPSSIAPTVIDDVISSLSSLQEEYISLRENFEAEPTG